MFFLRIWLLFLLACWFLLPFPSPATAQSSSPLLGSAIHRLLDDGTAAPVRLLLGRETVVLEERVRAFYRQRDYQPAWMSDRGPEPQLFELFKLLRAASDEGLCPEHYRLADLETYLPLLTASSRISQVLPQSWQPQFELLLTQAYFTYASELLGGQVNPARNNPN